MSNASNLYPKRRSAACKYAGIYLKKNPDEITYTDIQVFKEYLYDAIHNQNLSPKQISTLNEFNSSNFCGIITGSFGIKLKDHKSAQRNTAIQKGNMITDHKRLYYKQCEFDLSQKEMTKIPGFDLVIKHGMYHPVNNPNGAVRDHILSKAEAYQKGYDPSHIRHPANCQFITNQENIKKNSHSDITYDQLLERISLWEQNVVPELSKERRIVEKSPEHIENIRKAIVNRYEKIRSGEIIVGGDGRKGIGRPPTFHKKHDWDLINQDILDGLTRKQICEKRNITIDTLMGAKRKGLVLRHPKR